MMNSSTPPPAAGSRSPWLWWLVLCLMAGITGCSSVAKSHSNALATVTIQGNTPGQIQPTVVEVFQEHGFHLANSTPTELVFEKPGSGWDNLAYGNWVDSPTSVRVKVGFVLVGDTDCVLECHAYVVRDKGTATEEEMAVGRRKPYEQILQEVAKRFARRG